jgi:hypothetical protein
VASMAARINLDGRGRACERANRARRPANRALLQAQRHGGGCTTWPREAPLLLSFPAPGVAHGRRAALDLPHDELPTVR